MQGQRRELLRDNHHGGGHGYKARSSLSPPAATLTTLYSFCLKPTALTAATLRRADASHRRKLLRNHHAGRGQQWRHSLQASTCHQHAHRLDQRRRDRCQHGRLHTLSGDLQPHLSRGYAGDAECHSRPGMGFWRVEWRLPWHRFLHRYDDAILVGRRHLFPGAAIRRRHPLPSGGHAASTAAAARFRAAPSRTSPFRKRAAATFPRPRQPIR